MITVVWYLLDSGILGAVRSRVAVITVSIVRDEVNKSVGKDEGCFVLMTQMKSGLCAGVSCGRCCLSVYTARSFRCRICSDIT